MKKIYYLKTCDSCRRIMKQIRLEGFITQDIKSHPITVDQLEEMKLLSGDYESLFSRRAKKYTQMGLKDQKLQEIDYKQLILSDYTFLKRPVIIFNNAIYIGNSKQNIKRLLEKLNSE